MGFAGRRGRPLGGCKRGQRSLREMRCCYETCYESGFIPLPFHA